MNFTYASLDTVPVTGHTPHSEPANRTHQGIPSIERLPSGRLFTTWYTGGTTECRENYVVLAYSDDDGATWKEADAVIDPPNPDVRAFDPALWLAPNGQLYWFWAQGCGCNDGICGIVDEVFDGLEGVWFTIIENPSDTNGNFTFTQSCRISNGIMLNKPTALSDGTWALPCSLWSVKGSHQNQHFSLNPLHGAMMIVSEDNGKTFSLRGAVDVTTYRAKPSFDEHQFLELKDGSIACYIRCADGVGRSISRDGGRTWGPVECTDLPGKDCRFHIRRLASGRVLLVANNSHTVRDKLTAFLSEDDGATWPYQLLIDERKGVSYPDGVEDAQHNLYISYDFNRTQGGFLYLNKITEEDIIRGSLASGSFIQREISHSKPVQLTINN